jgi:asparagine synthetase B (glutamine-hydrolysing)
VSAADAFVVQLDLETFALQADRPLPSMDGCFAALVGYLVNDQPDKSQRLIRAYMNHGMDLSLHLLGEYAGVIIDTSSKTALLVQDSFGLRTLYYALDGNVLSVAATLNNLASARGKADVNPAYFACLLSTGIPPFDQAPLAGVERLALGTTVRFRLGQKATVRPWRPNPAYRLSDDLSGQLRALLDEAVASALPLEGKVGCELSGGLDSTSVITTASALRNDVHAVTLFSGQDLMGEDDIFAKQVISRLNLTWHRIDVDKYPMFGAIPDTFIGEPGDESRELIQRAFRGIVEQEKFDVILRGAGGDVIFGYGGLPPFHLADAIATGRLGNVVETATLWSSRRGNLRPWTHYLMHFGIKPAILHLRGYRIKTGNNSPPRWMAEEFVHQHGLNRGRERPPAPRVAKPSEQYLWDSVFQMSSTEAICGFRQCLRADTRCPLLYRPLVEFMLALHWSERDAGFSDVAGGDRVLQRRALSDRLPESIRLRRTKGSDQPLRETTLMKDKAWVGLLTRDSRLAMHGWVDPGRWAEQVARARFGVFGDLASFDAAMHSEIWLRTLEAFVPGRPALLTISEPAGLPAG